MRRIGVEGRLIFGKKKWVASCSKTRKNKQTKKTLEKTHLDEFKCYVKSRKSLFEYRLVLKRKNEMDREKRTMVN